MILSQARPLLPLLLVFLVSSCSRLPIREHPGDIAERRNHFAQLLCLPPERLELRYESDQWQFWRVTDGNSRTIGYLDTHGATIVEYATTSASDPASGVLNCSSNQDDLEALSVESARQLTLASVGRFWPGASVSSMQVDKGKAQGRQYTSISCSIQSAVKPFPKKLMMSFDLHHGTCTAIETQDWVN